MRLSLLWMSSLTVHSAPVAVNFFEAKAALLCCAYSPVFALLRSYDEKKTSATHLRYLTGDCPEKRVTLRKVLIAGKARARENKVLGLGA
jgi:hypothetical protein